MPRVDVRCDGSRSDGWTCAVALSDGERVISRHRVRVSTDDLDRLAPGSTDPGALVEQSFEFLLEHEPPSSILKSFDLTVIGRYFPEYDREIRRRMAELS